MNEETVNRAYVEYLAMTPEKKAAFVAAVQAKLDNVTPPAAPAAPGLDEERQAILDKIKPKPPAPEGGDPGEGGE